MSMKRSVAAGRVRIAGQMIAVAIVGFTAMPAAADSTLKVYRSKMADGTVVLGDKPAPGARSVESSTYIVTEPRQRSSADAEREYWRRQSDAFERRQMMRDAGSRGGSRQWSTLRDRQYGGGDAVVYHDSGYAAQPLVSLNQVPRVYESSPGAVRGRDGGFIGSGFSTAR